jgi:hypothetical protein
VIRFGEPLKVTSGKRPSTMPWQVSCCRIVDSQNCRALTFTSQWKSEAATDAITKYILSFSSELKSKKCFHEIISYL